MTAQDCRARLQLAALAAECSTILREGGNGDLFAIPLLHVRSAHPASLTQFRPVMEGRQPGLSSRVRSLAETQAIRLLSLWRNEPKWSGDDLPNRADVLFISHLLSEDQAGHGRDIYFGDLPRRLVAGGVSSVVAHINHSHHPWRRLAGQWSHRDVPRVLLSRTTGGRDAFMLTRRLVHAGRRAAEVARDRHCDPSLRAWLPLNARSPAAFSALRIAHQVEALVERLRPRWLVTTFEGHGWERLVFAAAHRLNPQTVCIGYHHTVLFPQAHALGAVYGDGRDPDIVLTAGEITADWFRKQPVGQSAPVAALGTVRMPQASGDAGTVHGSDCLVVPEGIVDEAVILFRLAADAARLDGSLHFRLRLHPVLSREAVLATAPDLMTLPPTVRWSVDSLDDDMVACRTVLYRGSTAALTGVLAGLRPIYATAPSDVELIDPLVDAGAWRLQVGDSAGLAAALRDDLVAEPQARGALQRQGEAYCRRYFMPLAPDRFLALFANAGEEKTSD